ncbi:LPS-assembly protein [Granulicella rosea]|uniref:LPS-assembly protein n=1 Tax=Granulicella rosea TaxID=474952 RepID=A0A239LP97_9BACT|nr:LPS assembly protein LptD [Granulicella rosea]SNT31464.1 LPS-assembly protein [Granulicella rosea]
MPGFRWASNAFSPYIAARRAYLFISITLLGGFHPQLAAQQVTPEAPPPAAIAIPAEPPAPLPDRPGQTQFPVAQIVTPPGDSTLVKIDSATQSESGGVYVLDGNVTILYKDHTVQADHIEYDANTDEVTATGHLTISGGSNHEVIHASHATMNLKTSTGRFYDVTGSVGVKVSPNMKLSYTNSNPFLFTGRLVVKTGEHEYEVYDGTVTSCQLPKPDWLLAAAHLSFDGDKARARNSIFHLLNIPLLYLPYVTHPVDSEDRQSGILIPVISKSSTKGLVIGEEIYFVINRSMDMTVGAAYYSSVGWEQSAVFRWKGAGNDFATAHYNGVLDRQPPGPTNQGGEDVLFSGRRDLSQKTRLAATVEYLSSYIYREAFTPNFNQAVTSDVVSTMYATRESNGIETALEGDRYQGIKEVQSVTAAGQQVRIFHAPALEVSTTDHAFAGTNLQWSFDASAAGLKRTQPNFTTSGVIERFDLHPELAFPFGLPGGWRFRPSIAGRETLYTRSRVTPYTGTVPVESEAGLSRSDVEVKVDARPPVLERTFALKGGAAKLFGPELKHTIQPELTYRYTTGVGNFLNVLRFDEADVVADTNEAEYGVTQRIYLRPRKHSCNTAEVSQEPGLNTEDAEVETDDAGGKKTCPNEEWISWRLSQKYFFDQSFGGAVIRGRRNIFDSTLQFSGVAFLTEPRETSPILSRLRIRTNAKMDLEWDFDYDSGAKKFTSNNVFIDLHQGKSFGALSYARLDAPGRFYTQGTSSSTSNFSQLRVLMGYGVPTKPGLSVAANAGIDLDAGSNVTTTVAATATTPATTTTSYQSLLQYAALQSSYNWNCCGISVEYRKYELGSVRNEGVYRFNFTLVNVGTAGNLKRAERLF